VGEKECFDGRALSIFFFLRFSDVVAHLNDFTTYDYDDI